MAKATKQTKKFQKNHLKRAIDDRKTFQKKKATIERAKKAKEARSNRSRKALGVSGQQEDDDDDDDEEDDDDDDDDAAAEDDEPGSGAFQGMSVEDFLSGGFKAGMDSDAEDDDDEEGEDGEDMDSDDELSELEDLSDGEGHMQDLEQLKEKDPEFYKYLQENDKDLLQFGGEDSEGDDEEDEDNDMEDDDDAESSTSAAAKGKGRMTAEQETQEVVTLQLLRSWQKAMIQQRSLKALRKLLLAFRAAAHMNDADEATGSSTHAYAIEEATVFNKLIITALKYTPVVLQHHIPAKPTANGKFKLPTQNKKFALLQRPIQMYFSNLHHLLRTLSEPKMLYVAVTESAKMVPFVMNNRRMAREYVKVMLSLWSEAADNVRIGAFLSLRKVAQAGDDAMLDLCLRGAYLSFIRSTKLTTMHTLPSINLMKNSGSELFALDLTASYQQAFAFIRQLAIHLRNALKTKSADAFKGIYNWQYLHCVDFWSLVLSTVCDKQRIEERGENELQQLIYPLVQVATGVIRLIPTSRYFPLRMHLLRSMLRLMQRTGVYIPLTPSLLEMLSAPEFTRKPKGSTLKPLEFSTTLRAPAAYTRTRVYADQLAEEVPHLLLEFLATQSRSIAFPEMVVPLCAQLRRTLKHGTSPKLSSTCKQILTKVDANAKWIETKRKDVDFAPNNLKEVDRFLKNLDAKAESPLEGALRLARKVRDQKRKVVEMQEQQV